jgi:hypothetical protein
MEDKSAFRLRLGLVLAALWGTEEGLYHKVLDAAAMANPWRPRRRGWTNVLDQLLHMLYAAVVLFPFMIWPSYGGAAISGLLLGLIREVEQFHKVDLKIHMPWDRLSDIFFFVVGAVATYHVCTAWL